jgi:hypothetical protein
MTRKKTKRSKVIMPPLGEKKKPKWTRSSSHHSLPESPSYRADVSIGLPTGGAGSKYPVFSARGVASAPLFTLPALGIDRGAWKS